MMSILVPSLLAVGAAVVLLVVMALLALVSQKWGKRYVWYARHEDVYLLLLMYKIVLLAVGVGYLIGVAR
jgi:hypothetical protein